LTTKVYGFCVEPEAFSPVIQKIDQIAIERHTSRSDVISDILFSYFGIENISNYKKFDFSNQRIRRNRQ
jgi:hypothetical protein